jgi:hypothetical protein
MTIDFQTAGVSLRAEFQIARERGGAANMFCLRDRYNWFSKAIF